MRFIQFVGFALSLAAASACSTYDLTNESNDTEIDPTDTGTDVVDPDTDGDDEAPQPEYWRLDGTFTIAAGEIVPESSVLHVDYWAGGVSLCSNQAEDTATDAAVSGTDVVVVSAASAASPEDLPLLGLWMVQLTEGETPCPRPIPTEPIYLGVGPIDARLYPAMAAEGFADPAAEGATLYSAYAGEDPGAMSLYGLAGTEAQYAGTDAAVTVGPVADGVYRISSLHLLPLAE